MIRMHDQDQLVATVIPTVGSTIDRDQVEQRISRSFHILATIPDDKLEAIANSSAPLNALALYLDSLRRHAAH